MHLPATSETIYDAFNHRTYASGLAGAFALSLGNCPCEMPALPFRGIGKQPKCGMGQASAATAAIGGGISAGVSLATSAASLWMNSIQLSHDADTATTQIVNGLAPLLQQNVNAYLAGPGTCADQAAAMSAYLTAVQWLMSAAGCGNGAYGSAGNRCISDRFGPNGATDTNAKYPWASYYYVPIATDPRAAACATATQGTEAGEESAITNIQNLVSGNPTQTTAGTFAASSSPVSTPTVAASSPVDLSSLTSGSVEIGTLSVPTIAFWGAGALILILALSGGRH